MEVVSLIFDLDGTLVDSSGDITESLNVTLKALGLPQISNVEVRGFVGDGVMTLLARATGKNDDALLQKAVEIFKTHYTEHCTDATTLYPGVEETLRFLKDRKKALVSNKPRDMILKTLKHFSIEGCFDVVMGAESTARRKPDPEPVIRSLELMDAPKRTALMVGDGTTDVQAGKAAGIATCAVSYGYRSRDELMKFQPDFMIDKFTDLKDILKRG